MPSVDINYWAVLVAAIINMMIGSLWYSPSLFGKAWSKLVGKSMKDMRANGQAGYAILALGALVQSWILVHFIEYAGSTTIWEGVVTGFWLWLAFVAIVMAGSMIFEGRPWKLWRINAGYFLAVLVINGALLAAWR
ncbi:MAG: DUF1761 domain-containing protein [Candidatus Saccharimonadales bacterium]|jgi:hypothetical protein